MTIKVVVRIHSANALGVIRYVGAVEPLITKLKDNDYEVRMRSAVALSRIGDERAVEPLIKCLDDERLSVILSSIRALGKIGDERAIIPIMDKYRKNLNSEINKYSAEAVKNLSLIHI